MTFCIMAQINAGALIRHLLPPQLDRGHRRAAHRRGGAADSGGGAEGGAGGAEQTGCGGAAAQPRSAERVVSQRALRPAARQVQMAELCHEARSHFRDFKQS